MRKVSAPRPAWQPLPGLCPATLQLRTTARLQDISFLLLLNAAGDAALLTMSCGAGYTNLSAIESVLQPLQNIVAPNKTQSVLGFGTGSKLQKTKV